MPMNYEEAKRQLVLHAGAIDEAQKAMILEDGFLPSLRPYRGLQEKNIHLVMEALLTVGERIHSAPQVDRELIKTIWWMCTTARLWGLRPDGMLQASKLLTAEDILRLELWVNAIEETALSLLGGSPPHKAVYHYAKYVVEIGWWDNIGFFIPLMQRAVSDRDIGSAITMILRALSKLGSLAKGICLARPAQTDPCSAAGVNATAALASPIMRYATRFVSRLPSPTTTPRRPAS